MTKKLVGVTVFAGAFLVASAVGGVFGFDVTVPVSVTAAFDGFTFEKFLARWWVFPASVVFSLVALAAGVSGALFFSPFFMIVVGLSAPQAIGAGLLTELFGMGNGLRAYVGQGVVDYATAKWLLAAAVPAVVVGAFSVHYFPESLLRSVFGVGLVALGGFFFFYETPENCEPGEPEGDLLREKNTGRGKTVVEASDGTRYEYDKCWRTPGVALLAVGASVMGLISAGLPEIVTTQLIVRCRIPPRVAVATSIFVLGVTAAAGAAVHALSATPVWYIVAWSIPGVLVGGTVGTRVGKHVPSELMETGLGVVFGVVGVVVLVTTFLL